MWRLLGLKGAYCGRFFNLEADNINIGKGGSCSVCLVEEQSIAENQAELLLCNGSYVFKDLSSTLPSKVNGSVPAGMLTLSHGNIVQIGESVFRVEKNEVTVRATACAIPRAETKNAELSSSSLHSIPWKLVAAVVLVSLLFAAIAIPNIKRANSFRISQSEKMQLAKEVIASLQSLGSALKVSISYPEYMKKVADSQAKIDAYLADYPESNGDEVGTAFTEAQQAYIDAGDLWEYKLSHNGDNYFTGSEEPGYSCLSRYRELYKSIDNGGAAVDLTTSNGGNRIAYNCEAAMQILWYRASEEISNLKLPESN